LEVYEKSFDKIGCNNDITLNLVKNYFRYPISNTVDTVLHRVVAQESHATFGGQPSMPTGAAAIVVTNNIIYDGGDGGHSVVSPGYLATT
jgi:hypothetical protein